MNNNSNNSILYKELNLGFVYVIIFLVGLIIAISMISYINLKVKDITNDYTLNDSF